MNKDFKSSVINACIEELNRKIAFLQNELESLTDGAETDAKSSAGDKHETARAMMQLEQEKIGSQLNDALAQKALLEQINSTPNTVVGNGSLIKTNRAYLFLGAAIGKVNADDQEVMTLSLQSPLGQKLKGLKTGDTAEVNGIRYLLEELL